MFRRRETASNGSVDAGHVSPRMLIRPMQGSFDDDSKTLPISPLHHDGDDTGVVGRLLIRPPAIKEEDNTKTMPPPPPEELPAPSTSTSEVAQSQQKKKNAVAAEGEKPKVFLKPNLTLEASDSSNTQQEFTIGKGIIRPLVSPLHQSKPDVFSRISFRKKSSAAAPGPTAPSTKQEKAKTPTDDAAEETESKAESRPTIVRKLEDEGELEVIARIAERRRWGKTLPTTNPHVLHALLKETHPFKKVRDLERATAMELTTAIESTIYCTPRALTSANRFTFQRGDVVVAGSPRCGQTPILRILDGLSEKASRPANALVNNVVWVEGPYAVPAGAMKQSSRRILKTHMPCENALRRDSGKIEHKMIVVLRDPADIRLSWYRHVRRLVKKCAHKSIDKNTGAAAFADASVPMPCSAKGLDLNGVEIEYMIASALKAQQEHPQNVLIVFYEQLFTDPAKVVESIARFTNFMEAEAPPKRVATSSGGEEEDSKVVEARKRQEIELIYSIAKGIMEDACHPDSTRRNGSSGQGAVCLPRITLEAMDDSWERIMKASEASAKFNSYVHLYQTLAKEKYVFADEKQSGGGSGGRFARLSNLTSANTSSMGAESRQSRLRKKDSSLDNSSVITSTTTGNRLKKQTSSAESEQPIVKPRKFGGSLIRLFSAGSFNLGSSSSKHPTSPTTNGKDVLPLPERPAVSTLPQVYYCVDPDDSDDEASKAVSSIDE